MKAESHSSSEFLTALLYGGPRKGMVLSRRDLRFGDYVLTLTAPHAPRMPNGIECRVLATPSSRVVIGRGRLVVGHFDVAPGAEWNPLPVFEPIESLPAGPEPLTGALGAWIPAPELAHDALVLGYVAGLVLLHGQRKRAELIAQRAMHDASPLTATLLRHAARGEVPEPVHALLATRETGPLITSSPAGLLWLRGLVSAGLPLEPATALLASGRRTPELHRL